MESGRWLTFFERIDDTCQRAEEELSVRSRKAAFSVQIVVVLSLTMEVPRRQNHLD
jgi:hypothetical protein